MVPTGSGSKPTHQVTHIIIGRTGPVRYTNWDRSHKGRERHSCAAMRTDRPVGLWLNFPCNAVKPFICEIKRILPTTTRMTTPSRPSTVRPIRCPRYFTEYNGYCYRSFYGSGSNLKTWPEALEYCRHQGASLISVHNATEANWIKSRVIRSTRGSYWIGLNNIDRSKGYGWTDGSAFNFNKWATGQPDNHNDQEDCVEWDARSNLWRDSNCYTAKGFVCQMTKGAVPVTTTRHPMTTQHTLNCGSGRSWRYFSGNCYFFYYGSYTWFRARNYCLQTVGGDLVSIQNQEENNFVLSTVSKQNMGQYWTGLNELNMNGLEWSDGEPVVYRNWDVNEPNDQFGSEKCVTLVKGNGNWRDDNCAQRYGFICKQLNGTKQTMSTPGPTSVLPGNCPTGWATLGNKCYMIKGDNPSDRLNWTSADKACKNFGKTFELVTINNELEQMFISSLLREHNLTYWIGLNQLRGYRRFVWEDNSVVKYTNWDKGEPNGNRYTESRKQKCVEIRSHASGVGKWADQKCAVVQGYVCQGYKDKSRPNPITTPLPSWCKTGYTVYGQSCYMMKPSNQTWGDALKTCQADGGSLVSITSQFEENFIRILTYGISGNFWTGMSDSQLKGIYRWSDGWPILYTNWNRGEPSRSDGEGCVALVTRGAWSDTMCNNTYRSICEMTTATPPPFTTEVPGYCLDNSWKKNGTLCYYLSTGYLTWPEAQFDCKQRGMRLATIHGKDEVAFIVEMARPRRLRYDIWIGLVNAFRAGFKWDDDSPVGYTNWAKNEPSNGRTRTAEDCVYMQRSNGFWYDIACNNRRYYLCVADMVMPTAPLPASTATPTPGSTLATTKTPPPKTGTPLSPSKHSSSSKSGITAAQHSAASKKSSQRNPPITAPHRPTRHPPVTPKKYIGQNPNQDGGGLGGGAIAGICVGIICIIVLVVLGVAVSMKRGYLECLSYGSSQSFVKALYRKTDDDVAIQ